MVGHCLNGFCAKRNEKEAAPGFLRQPLVCITAILFAYSFSREKQCLLDNQLHHLCLIS